MGKFIASVRFKIKEGKSEEFIKSLKKLENMNRLLKTLLLKQVKTHFVLWVYLKMNKQLLKLDHT